jgi:hypothetical protein
MLSISSGSTYRKRDFKPRYVYRRAWAEVGAGRRFAVYVLESEPSATNSNPWFDKKQWTASVNLPPYDGTGARR